MSAVLQIPTQAANAVASVSLSFPPSFSPPSVILPQQEFSSVGRELQKQSESWKFLAKEDEDKLKSGISSIDVKGHSFEAANMRYASDGRLHFDFTFKSTDPTNTTVPQKEDLMSSLRPILGEFRERGLLAITNVNIDISAGSISITGTSVADKEGDRFRQAGRLSNENCGLFTEAGRKEIFLAAARQIEVADWNPKVIQPTVEKLSALRDYYAQDSSANDPRLTLLAQALVLKLKYTPDEALRFRQIHDQQRDPVRVEDFPESFQRDIAKAIEQTKDIPSDAEISKRETIGKDVQLSTWITKFLDAEVSLGGLSPVEKRRAEIELKADIVEISKVIQEKKPATLEHVLSEIGNYYDQRQPSGYLGFERQGMHVPGFGARIASHDTDCSSRTMRVREVLSQFGVPSTALVIEIPVNPEQQANSPMAHTFLEIKKIDGSSVYFDPSHSPAKDGVFDSKQPIVDHYAGQSNRDKVRVTSTLVTDEQVITRYLCEYLEQGTIGKYLTPLAESGLPRSEFLFEHPELILFDRGARSFARVILSIDPTSEIAKACSGSAPELLQKHFGKSSEQP